MTTKKPKIQSKKTGAQSKGSTPTTASGAKKETKQSSADFKKVANKVSQETPQKQYRTLYGLFFKRFFDVVLSFLGLIILSPVFLITAILVRIKLGGPVIFKQLRPGKDGKVFNFYKFRSMTNAVDKDGNLLPDEDRITKFGKFIRKTSLDELPQLWNILKGDMSIIGPRPKLVKDMLFFNNEAMKGYSVRPGMTGLAQVRGRTNSSWDEVFNYNRLYIKKISVINDIKIFFMTFFALFKGAETGAGEIPEYYYADYLVNHNLITEAEYKAGLQKAKQIKAGDVILSVEKQKEQAKANKLKAKEEAEKLKVLARLKQAAEKPASLSKPTIKKKTGIAGRNKIQEVIEKTTKRKKPVSSKADPSKVSKAG